MFDIFVTVALRAQDGNFPLCMSQLTGEVPNGLLIFIRFRHRVPQIFRVKVLVIALNLGMALLAHPILLRVVDITAHGPVCNRGELVLPQLRTGQVLSYCPQIAKDHNIVKVILRQTCLVKIPIDLSLIHI